MIWNKKFGDVPCAECQLINKVYVYFIFTAIYWKRLSGRIRRRKEEKEFHQVNNCAHVYKSSYYLIFITVYT